MWRTMAHIHEISPQLETTGGKKKRIIDSTTEFPLTTEAELSGCIISPKRLCGPHPFDLLAESSGWGRGAGGGGGYQWKYFNIYSTALNRTSHIKVYHNNGLLLFLSHVRHERNNDKQRLSKTILQKKKKVKKQSVRLTEMRWSRVFARAARSRSCVLGLQILRLANLTACQSGVHR